MNLNIKIMINKKIEIINIKLFHNTIHNVDK